MPIADDDTPERDIIRASRCTDVGPEFGETATAMTEDIVVVETLWPPFVYLCLLIPRSTVVRIAAILLSFDRFLCANRGEPTKREKKEKRQYGTPTVGGWRRP